MNTEDLRKAAEQILFVTPEPKIAQYFADKFIWAADMIDGNTSVEIGTCALCSSTVTRKLIPGNAYCSRCGLIAYEV